MKMSKFNKIHVLKEFKPYLRLIKAFNLDNFRNTGNRHRILNSVFDAFATSSIIFSIPIFLILGVWYLIENDADLRKISVALPILISILWMWLIFIALMAQNRIIRDIIDQLQRVVGQSG